MLARFAWVHGHSQWGKGAGMQDERSALAEGLLARVRRYVDAGEAAVVQAREAEEEAARLGRIAMLHPNERLGRLVGDLHLIGWLYLCRFQVLAPGQDLPDLHATARLLAVLCSTSPDALPLCPHLLVEMAGLGPRWDKDRNLERRLAEARQQLSAARRTADTSGIDRAVQLYRAATAAVPSDHPDHGGIWCNLAAALNARFRLHGRMADLDAAVAAVQEAVRFSPAEAPETANFVTRLAELLTFRFAHAPTEVDWRTAVTLLEQALATMTPDHPEASATRGRAQELHTWLLRHRRDGPAQRTASVPEHLEAAGRSRSSRSRWRRWLRLPPARDSTAERRDVSFETLASLADGKLRASLDGEPGALDAAIGLYRRAIHSCEQTGSAAYADAVFNLGASMIIQYQRSGRAEDLDAAVEIASQAVTLSPQDASCSANLSEVLLLRFLRSHDPGDLDAAVEARRHALSLAPAGSPNRYEYIRKLIHALTQRIKLSGRPSDASEAAMLVHLLPSRVYAAGRTTHETANPAGCILDLVEALKERYLHTGSRALLDAAVDILRNPWNGEELATLRLARADALDLRYSVAGSRSDLEEAILTTRDALSDLLSGAPNHANALALLAHLLTKRSAHLHGGPWHNPEDIDEAVTLARKAVSEAVSGEADHEYSLDRLRSALARRYSERKTRQDLDAAITASNELVSGTSTQAAEEWASVAAGHADLLHIRYNADGDRADLNRAITLQRRVTHRTPEGHRLRGLRLACLGMWLYERCKAIDGETDAHEAMAALESAASSSSTPSQARLFAARAWGQALAEHGDWASALGAYRIAIAQLPALVWRGIGRASQEDRLTDVYQLAQDAAACAIAAGHPEEAVELLDQGRSILWNQADETRLATESLRQADSDLADRLEFLRDHLVVLC